MAEIRDVAAKADREARAQKVAAESQKAREEYESAIEARDLNTARLKALRLERDSAEAQLQAGKATAAKTKTAKVRRVRPRS